LALPPNRIKAAVRSGAPALVMSMQYPAPSTIEILGTYGCHGVYMDLEHGSFSPESIDHGIRAAECVGITPMVRIPAGAMHLVGPLLDQGIMGVIFSHINSPAEARCAVAATRFPPHGARGGTFFVRAPRYGSVSWDAYARWTDDEVLVICLIESREGIANIDAILDVDGIDVIFLGPGDLSIEMGVGGQMGHPMVRDALSGVCAKALARGIAVAGLALLDRPDDAQYWVDQGARVLVASLTKTLSMAVADTAARVTAMVKPR